MEDGKPADDILAKRGFESGAGVNLGDFLKSDIEEIKPEKETEDPAVFVSCLYKALDSLSSTTAPIEKKTLINKVFEDFCVGK